MDHVLWVLFVLTFAGTHGSADPVEHYPVDEVGKH